tara:strand:- start:43 stop:837 length:795 start_codon:yes stop_codon:yes gene_type:complete
LEKREIKGVSHYVFDNIEEFKEHFKKILPRTPEIKENWRFANEKDWVLSDDDRIVQLLKVAHKVKHHGDRKNYKFARGWVRTVVGTFINRDNTIMDTDFSSHANRYTFSKTIKNPSSRVRKRTKPTNKEKEFATNVVVGMGAVKAYMTAFNEENQYNARKKSAILLKQERIRMEIDKTALEVAKELGIDHKYILQKLKDLADFSEDDGIILQSAKELGKALGTLGHTTKQKEVGVIGMFQGFSPKELEKVERKEIVEETQKEGS